MNLNGIVKTTVALMLSLAASAAFALPCATVFKKDGSLYIRYKVPGASQFRGWNKIKETQHRICRDNRREVCYRGYYVYDGVKKTFFIRYGGTSSNYKGSISFSGKAQHFKGSCLKTMASGYHAKGKLWLKGNPNLRSAQREIEFRKR